MATNSVTSSEDEVTAATSQTGSDNVKIFI